MSSHPVWSYAFYKYLWKGLDWLFPPVCAGCGRLGFRWCRECQNKIIPLPEPICDICGAPQRKNGICKLCLTSRPPYQVLRSWAVFEGPVRGAIHHLKYRRDLGLGDALSLPVAEYIHTQNWEIDLVIPVPLSNQRYKERGYNQIALVASPLALMMGLEYSPKALVRKRHTRSQVGLSALERKQNVEGAFSANPKMTKGKSILLLDDVATTGSTLVAASDALVASGSITIYALTLARALSHHGFDIA